jgi:CubicO group peptidase (beta-lactamase class C family)
MSCTKAAVAIVCHQVAERGRLDLDAPVARCWPEFAANGNADLTVSHLKSHSAGLMSFDPDNPLAAEDTLDWARCTRALAAMKPLWAPGSARLSLHHIRLSAGRGRPSRVGQSFGAYLANEIARPLSPDLRIGLPADQLHRVAPHFRATPRADAAAMRERFAAFDFDTGDRLVRAVVDAFATLDGLIDLMTEPRGRTAEILAGNGVGNPRSLAKLYAACIGNIDGVRVLARDAVRRGSPRRGKSRVAGRNRARGSSAPDPSHADLVAEIHSDPHAIHPRRCRVVQRRVVLSAACVRLSLAFVIHAFTYRRPASSRTRRFVSLRDSSVRRRESNRSACVSSMSASSTRGVNVMSPGR